MEWYERTDSIHPAGVGSDGMSAQPAEEQKRSASSRLETFRLAGTIEAMEKSKTVTTIFTTVQ